MTLERLRKLTRTRPYRDWAKSHPVDAGKVAAEIRGERRPLPASGYARYFVEEAREAHKAEARRGVFELSGVVRHHSHFTPDTEQGRAFLAAGGSRVVLQFADPVSDAENRAAFPGWAERWRNLGVRVDGWWRVNHWRWSGAPLVPVTGIGGWWPNAETPDEIARLQTIYADSNCVGVMTLGKAPGAWPPPNGLCAIECFRENDSSDHTITNSVAWWRQASLPDDQLVVMLQGYGTPFAPPVQQARTAVGLGVRRLMLYPADGFSAADITAIGKEAA